MFNDPRADTHILQAPSRIKARRQCKTEVGRDQTLSRPLCDLDQRGNPRATAPGANAGEALGDQDPVGMIEPNDVGDRAERDQVQQLSEVRFL